MILTLDSNPSKNEAKEIASLMLLKQMVLLFSWGVLLYEAHV